MTWLFFAIASVVAVSISNVQVVTTVLLATVLLKEKNYLPRKLLAAAMVLAGVLLIK